jgi:hypothetical protein
LGTSDIAERELSSKIAGGSSGVSVSERKMTIFGFNTDVKHEDTVYHVQSEARQADLLLQTLVFVRGQCVGKCAFSYAPMISQPGFSHAAMHELLKMQHRTVVEGIRSGQAGAIPAASAEVQDLGGTGLAVAMISMERENSGATLLLRLLVTDSGQPAPHADVKCWTEGAGSDSVLARAAAGASGHVDLQIPANEDVLRESAVMVHAALGEKSATRKFRFKK